MARRRCSDVCTTSPWTVKNVSAPEAGHHYAEELEVDALAGGEITPKTLKVRFAPNVKKHAISYQRHVWSVGAQDYIATVEAEIPYVRGFGGQIVFLGNAVPPNTRGTLDDLPVPGFRWMRTIDDVGQQYWNGREWKPLPAGFALTDSNHTEVGFYRDGNAYVSQLGGEWPDVYIGKDMDATLFQRTLAEWKTTIEETWSGRYALKRSDCKSANKECCRYVVWFDVSFVERPKYERDVTLIFAAGSLRSNVMMWSTGAQSPQMPAHEFGHILGNPDEYEKPGLDHSNGTIDENSLMGQLMQNVEPRHFGLIVSTFADAIREQYGKSFTFDVVRA